MKNLKHFLVLGLFIILAAFQNDNVGTYEVNTDYSTVKWTGYKIGGKHQGELKMKEGTLNMVDGVLKGGKFVIDMEALTCTDIEKEEMNKKLVEHLKSADFFNTEIHPTATFVFSKVFSYGTEEIEGQTYTRDTYKIIGDLTIKGITKPFKTKVAIYDYGTSVSGIASLEIDRTDFDIRYKSGSFFEDLGDKLIHDEIELEVSISASTDSK